MAPRLQGWPWVVVIWLAAVALLTAHLGDVPLRDWDESLVARVSLEISRRSWPHNLLPTLWDQAYLNKPPLVHGLIAAVLALWNGVHSGAITGGPPPPEWLVRCVPALLSSLVVPLVALVQARLRPEDRLAPMATAPVALTLLPLMRHGRLAMLDGTLISAMTLQWWTLLSLARQPSRLAICRGVCWPVWPAPPSCCSSSSGVAAAAWSLPAAGV
ncbi:MAG: phospholipid carrier-dependent glycosyltransferase [Cyanobacteria bacterium M_surface_10_m2_179]|nr:phospholipid carrier-dependent glycosyltransferase [Cyanobacteria bacterium M_surface_10_m2_179]